MSWSTRFTRHFSDRILQRGRAYYQRGAVHIWSGDDDHVNAKVRGTHTYRVRLDFDGQDLHVVCTCPHFDREILCCKHIWAVMLASERLGWLRGVARIRDPRLVSDRGFDELGDVDELPDDDILNPEEFAASMMWHMPAESPLWQRQLAELKQVMRDPGAEFRPDRELGYFVVLEESQTSGYVMIRVAQRSRKKNREWGVFSHRRSSIDVTPEVSREDQQILGLLAGGGEYSRYAYYSPTRGYPGSWPSSYSVPTSTLQVLMPVICETGRCYLIENTSVGERVPLEWDDGPAWDLWLQGREESNGDALISGVLRRGGGESVEQVSITEPWLVTTSVVFMDGRGARLDDNGASDWIALLQQGAVTVPLVDRQRFLSELTNLDSLPRLDLPSSLQIGQAALESPPQLHVGWGPAASNRPIVRAELRFNYNGTRVDWTDSSRVLENDGRALWRDTGREQDAVTRLEELGFQTAFAAGRPAWTIGASDFGSSVRALLDDGWTIEADGQLLRKASRMNVEVRSGVDWFELHGGAEFDGQSSSLPELLQAIERGDHAVVLGDGTLGLLPEEWLGRYQTAAKLGNSENGHIEFSRSQVALLDFLLASEPEAVFDETFIRLRDQIRGFEGIVPVTPGNDFTGTLREYQREGLGWLHFLRQFGFGGCLADDMGLGKTVQILALFASLDPEPEGQRRKPSLVVVPRSLIFNWQDEAARFAPKLKVLDYTGPGRSADRNSIDNYDMVLTTYGTLRRDAAILKDIRFDTIVLDEAQAIKNANTAGAKAARLLKADHRLALTGTPVENHLGELWSLFDVLNPGMLGSIRAFDSAVSNRGSTDADLEMLSRGLRPFILRRTKSEVMKELPEKIEQTIYCELKPKQRRLYNQLRQYYRNALLKDTNDAVIRRSKIKVLEALLRLRQAACHPGLIDKDRTEENSAKIDSLIPQILEVIQGGAKALVFSQFTSLLAIVRKRFDDEGVTYEYLDGRTRDRASRVHRFQNDGACRLFLISLKAGGLGLNLTAAEYVFILDPWWNPAVEAQAIDRTHRIGQTRQVFAYRLIARNTVEERILELQQSKKELADAIIGNQNSLIRTLGREDLEVLFS